MNLHVIQCFAICTFINVSSSPVAQIFFETSMGGRCLGQEVVDLTVRALQTINFDHAANLSLGHFCDHFLYRHSLASEFLKVPVWLAILVVSLQLILPPSRKLFYRRRQFLYLLDAEFSPTSQSAFGSGWLYTKLKRNWPHTQVASSWIV